MAFMDIEKAFDTVHRRKIWESLENRGVDTKLIRAIRSLYSNNKNYVISKNMRSTMFRTTGGLRQGGVMSPALFTVFMDDIIRRCNQECKSLYVGYRNLEKVEIKECAFADDVAIMAGSEKDLQQSLSIWNEAMKNAGMKLNKSKTKVMAIANEKIDRNITIDGTKINQVNQFKYLGAIIENNLRTRQTRSRN